MKRTFLNTDDLWKILERTLNSQNVKNPFNDKFPDISYHFQNFLNNNFPDESIEENVISFGKEVQSSEFDCKTGLFIDELKHYFDTNLSDFIIVCFIHGSIATNDYTGFSDVDVGIIVKNEVMLNPKFLKELKKKIKFALRIILKFDNLQHHGFFIIPEGFLNFYPEEYLPLEVLKHSRVLNKPVKLKIVAHRNNEQVRKNFLKVARIFIDENFKKPGNLYGVKHLLSQFMLLPTLYLQAKGVYVYKKYSFDIVKTEFPDDWWVMEEVSRIRQEWIRPKSQLFNTLLDTSPNPWVASLIYRKLNWEVPEWLSKRLPSEFYKTMRILTRKMIAKS